MKPDQNQSLARILESAIVVFWADLMCGAPAGLIHIEYGFSAGGTLDYLRFLSSISRGHWLLVGEYWMRASKSHCAGFRFENGHQSEGLLHLVELMMQHQAAFSLPEDRDRQGLLQISTPTREETATATTSVDEALERLDSRFAEPAHPSNKLDENAKRIVPALLRPPSAGVSMNVMVYNISGSNGLE